MKDQIRESKEATIRQAEALKLACKYLADAKLVKELERVAAVAAGSNGRAESE